MIEKFMKEPNFYFNSQLKGFAYTKKLDSLVCNFETS